MSYRKNAIICFILLSLCISFPRTFYEETIYNFNEHNMDNLKNPVLSQTDVLIDSYRVPSVTESISSDQIIKIGLLDDLNDMTGDHAWKGALLAARDVNEKGGVVINGSSYYVGLVAENTNEMYGTVLEGIEAAEKIINDHHPHFITGGFNEPIYQYLDIIMNEKIPFLGTGAAGNPLCRQVQQNYAKYKYFFRICPINMTSFVGELISYLIYLCSTLDSIDAGTINKTAILSFDGDFFNDIATVIKDWFPVNYPTISVEEPIRFPWNATLTDFINYWNIIDSAGVQVVLTSNVFPPLYGLMHQAYQQVQPKCLIISFSPFGQLNSDWDYVEGALQFDIALQAIHNTSKTSLTKPFFTRYLKEYDIEPFYTGVGSYDAVKLLVKTVQETQTFDPDITVSALEKINTTNYVEGVGGYAAFNRFHDLEYGYPFGHSLFCQWKYIDGTKVVVPHQMLMFGHGYPDSLSTGSLRLPYWGINGLLTTPPQPPGNFTVDSTAESPHDYDGKFNLTWTYSPGADNYSIYMSDNPFTYISKKFTLHDYQTATSPTYFPLKQGEYYFRVVAYNKTGEKMSSDYVHVSIPGPGPFDLYDNAGDPDLDGNFELTWTNSARAEDYSIYHYKKPITSINESLTMVENKSALSPYSVTKLSNGRYYFAVAAFNELGYTLSNNREISVRIPPDLRLLIIITVSSVAGVASIPIVRRYLKHKAEKKSERERQEHIIVEDVTREPVDKPKTGEKNK